MTTELHSAGDVIDALGGSGATAALSGKSIQSVSNWRGANKLAASTFLILSRELEARGFTAPPSLWGIKQPEAAE